MNDEKQIKEMAKDLCHSIAWTDLDGEPLIDSEQTCTALHDIGYRKQSEGEWKQMEFWEGGGTWRCTECKRQIMFLHGTPETESMNFCPNCGAKMFIKMTHTCPHNIPNLIPTIEELLKGDEE